MDEGQGHFEFAILSGQGVQGAMNHSVQGSRPDLFLQLVPTPGQTSLAIRCMEERGFTSPLGNIYC